MTRLDVLKGQEEDVKGALEDLAVFLGEDQVDWKTVAATLDAIAPIASRLAVGSGDDAFFIGD